METWKIKPVFDRKKKATPEKSAKVEIEIQFSRTERKWISTDIELYSNQWDREFVVRHAKFKELNRAITKHIKKFEFLAWHVNAIDDMWKLTTLSDLKNME